MLEEKNIVRENLAKRQEWKRDNPRLEKNTAAKSLDTCWKLR